MLAKGWLFKQRAITKPRQHFHSSWGFKKKKIAKGGLLLHHLDLHKLLAVVDVQVVKPRRKVIKIEGNLAGILLFF